MPQRFLKQKRVFSAFFLFFSSFFFCELNKLQFDFRVLVFVLKNCVEKFKFRSFRLKNLFVSLFVLFRFFSNKKLTEFGCLQFQSQLVQICLHQITHQSPSDQFLLRPQRIVPALLLLLVLLTDLLWPISRLNQAEVRFPPHPHNCFLGPRTFSARNQKLFVVFCFFVFFVFGSVFFLLLFFFFFAFCLFEKSVFFSFCGRII